MYQNNTKPAEEFAESTLDITQVAYKSINNLVESVVAQLPYVISGLLVIVFFWLLAKLLRVVFMQTSQRTGLDERLRVLFGRLLVVTVVVLGIFTALTVIIPNFTFGNLIAGLGFTSFIVGFATKDILNNLLSGVLILWQQPFKVGDYVLVKGNEGDVEYIGVRATRLKMNDGERVLVPNGDMYTNALIIRSAGALRRMKLQLSVDYDTHIKMAKEIIERVLRGIEGVENEPEPRIYVTDLASDGINLAIYFWVNTERHSPIAVLDEIATEIKDSLHEEEIMLYPPTRTVVRTEGEKESILN